MFSLQEHSFVSETPRTATLAPPSRYRRCTKLICNPARHATQLATPAVIFVSQSCHSGAVLLLSFPAQRLAQGGISTSAGCRILGYGCARRTVRGILEYQRHTGKPFARCWRSSRKAFPSPVPAGLACANISTSHTGKRRSMPRYFFPEWIFGRTACPIQALRTISRITHLLGARKRDPERSRGVHPRTACLLELRFRSRCRGTHFGRLHHERCCRPFHTRRSPAWRATGKHPARRISSLLAAAGCSPENTTGKRTRSHPHAYRVLPPISSRCAFYGHHE